MKNAVKEHWEFAKKDGKGCEEVCVTVSVVNFTNMKDALQACSGAGACAAAGPFVQVH